MITYVNPNNVAYITVGGGATKSKVEIVTIDKTVHIKSFLDKNEAVEWVEKYFGNHLILVNGQ